MSTDAILHAMQEGTFHPDWVTDIDEGEYDEVYREVYCDLCETEGHSFRTCAVRDDAPDAHLESAYEDRFEGDWD